MMHKCCCPSSLHHMQAAHVHALGQLKTGRQPKSGEPMTPAGGIDLLKSPMHAHDLQGKQALPASESEDAMAASSSSSPCTRFSTSSSSLASGTAGCPLVLCPVRCAAALPEVLGALASCRTVKPHMSFDAFSSGLGPASYEALPWWTHMNSCRLVDQGGRLQVRHNIIDDCNQLQQHMESSQLQHAFCVPAAKQ